MKTIKTLISLFILSVFSINLTYASNVEDIQVVDDKNITVVWSDDIVFKDGEVSGDVRVIKDVEVTFSQIDTADSSKVLLNLWKELKAGEWYNLLWAYGADWDMDFSVSDSISWEIANLAYDENSKSIQKINILDSKTIEIYYNYEVTSQILEYKILSELRVDSFSANWDNLLNVKLVDRLEKSSDYMLMLSDLRDVDSNVLEFDDYLYDFSTTSSLIQTISEEEIKQAVEELTTDEVNEETVVEEVTEMEEIALNAAENPEVWAATWFVMLLTFIVSSAYFMRNKFTRS